MAKVSPTVSDSEDANGATTSGKRDSVSKISTKAKESVEPQQDGDAQQEGEGEGSEEESEYEIEAILDAKRGAFPEGRIGYFVKWKGYGEEENSWVDEQDAGNAQVLIDDYWKKNPKAKKAPRKSTDAKTPKRPRKSAVPDDGSEVGSTSLIKKRGRKSQTKGDSDMENGKMEVDRDEVRVAKKPRKGSGTKADGAHPAIPSEEEQEDIGNMKNFLSVASWEELVKTVVTIERVEADNSLIVYFILTSGEHVKENSRLCAERFPQKLIHFYETNLRWRAAEDEADMAEEEA